MQPIRASRLVELCSLALLAASPAPASAAADACPAGMVLVRGGTLETATDLARVPSFCLDRTEVTADAYASCAGVGVCAAEDLECGNAATYGKKRLGAHPVNCVTWHEAETFCREHGKRLPTEAEWEWAARGGRRGTTFPWGEEEPGDRACWDGEGNALGKGERKGTCPVGANPRSRGQGGLEDLGGNVREWTATPEERFRVLRGGSWGDSLPEFLSSSFRGWNAPDERMEHLGFRCAAELGTVARRPTRAPVVKARAVTDDTGVMVFSEPIEIGRPKARR